MSSTGSIIGKVVDNDGNQLPGVTITATSPNQSAEHVAITMQNGEYRLPVVSAGQCTVKASMIGFQPSQRMVSVQPGGTSVADFELNQEH